MASVAQKDLSGDQTSLGTGKPIQARLDVLNDNVSGLQNLLGSGALTSEDLVKSYLAQIERHNLNGMNIRAIISVAPKASILEQARQLDKERSAKGSRGPMHGIPVLVKDTMWTIPEFGMETTCGSLSLVGAKAKKNAAVIDLLLNAGMLIIGKANLSELQNLKASPPNVAGWSAAGGQCLSPYVRGEVKNNGSFLGHTTPSGSSSGSAAGVAAGFAPIAIGQELDGSLVNPANRAGLYSLKIEPGKVDMEGTMPIGKPFDSHGAMARTPRDVSDMTEILMGKKGFSHGLTGSWAGLSVGFIDMEQWAIPGFVTEVLDDFNRQEASAYEEARKRIEAAGGRAVKDVRIMNVNDLGQLEGFPDPDDLFVHGFPNVFEEWLGGFDTSPVRTVEDVIDFNIKHASRCLPEGHSSQGFLESIVKKMPDPHFKENLAKVRNRIRAEIDSVLAKNKLDAILGPADTRLASIASLAGYAIGSMPLGYASFNGRAFGAAIIAGKDGEEQILKIMSAWEKTFPEGTQAPPMLVNWESKRIVNGVI